MTKKKKKSPVKHLSKEDQELFLQAFHHGHFTPRSSPHTNDGELFKKTLESQIIFFPNKNEEPNKILRKPQKTREDYSKIDLHGLTTDEAIVRLYDFINKQKKLGRKNLLIIHGKGAGILRGAVLSLIKSHPDVDDYKVAPGKLGGEGALVIWINKKRK